MQRAPHDSVAPGAEVVRILATLFPHVELDELAAVRVVAVRQPAPVFGIRGGEVVGAVAVAGWKGGDDC